MISYRDEVSSSWVKRAPSVRDLAHLVSMPLPVSLRALLERLRELETVEVSTDVKTPDGFPLGGSLKFILKSDGSYSFLGTMRATGFTSYHFALQAFVKSAGGAVVAAQRTGHVYGTDTPGDRTNSWSEQGINPGMREQWRAIRSGPAIGCRLDAEIGGVLGVGWDILKLAVEAIVANIALPGIGMIIVVGSELGAALGVRVATPDVLAGVAVAGGMILVLGPGIMVPSIVAGAAVASLTDIRHRSMTDEEREFARKVFLDRIPFDRVTLTNLSHDSGRAYTIPSIDGSILVNLNDAFDNPATHSGASDSDYSQPGSLFIHELTHVWQIAQSHFMPGLICDVSNNYSYHAGTTEGDRLNDRSWVTRRWSSDFNLEQQAHIVDDWYGAHYLDLNGQDAINDPAFHFIKENIRTGDD